MKKAASAAFKLKLEIEKSTTLTDRLNTVEHERDAAVKKAADLKHALANHIESRTILIEAMKDVFEYIVNNQTFHERVFTNYNWKGTYLESDEYPWRGFFHNKKGVTFGKFKFNEKDQTREGEGLIVSNDNFAYCGKIAGDRYHGTGLYYDREEGIQSG